MNKVFSSIGHFITKNESPIMLVTGLVGMGVSMYFAVKAAKNSKEILDRKKIEEDTPKIPVKETIKTVWKQYVPPVVTFGLSTACIIASYHTNVKRNAALTTALISSQSALETYRKEVLDVAGAETAKAVENKIVEKKVRAVPGNEKCEVKEAQNSIFYVDRNKTFQCIEETTNQKFLSNVIKIQEVENRLNQYRLSNFDNEVTLNDMYDEFDIPHTPIGDIMGWDINSPITLMTEAMLVDDEPCILVRPHGYRVFRGKEE